MARKHSDAVESRRLRVAAEVWWVESHWVILQILTRGIGWAFIPEHILKDSPSCPSSQYRCSNSMKEHTRLRSN